MKVLKDHSGRKGHNEQCLNGSIDERKRQNSKSNENEGKREEDGGKQSGRAGQNEQVRFKSAPVFGRTWPLRFALPATTHSS